MIRWNDGQQYRHPSLRGLVDYALNYCSSDSTSLMVGPQLQLVDENGVGPLFQEQTPNGFTFKFDYRHRVTFEPALEVGPLP